jgi:hypothetical protein
LATSKESNSCASTSSSTSSSSAASASYPSLFKLSQVDISEFIFSKSWIDQLVEAVDDCCFSITVASARQKGFPLVYVNKAFERTTGNFLFMQKLKKLNFLSLKKYFRIQQRRGSRKQLQVSSV